MCIRITRELKMIYEQEMKILLSVKIAFPVFVKILTIMGYINSSFNTKDYMTPAMTAKEEQLVALAWKTVKSQGDKEMEIYGAEELNQREEERIQVLSVLKGTPDAGQFSHDTTTTVIKLSGKTCL